MTNQRRAKVVRGRQGKLARSKEKSKEATESAASACNPNRPSQHYTIDDFVKVECGATVLSRARSKAEKCSLQVALGEGEAATDSRGLARIRPEELGGRSHVVSKLAPRPPRVVSRLCCWRPRGEEGRPVMRPSEEEVPTARV